MGTLNYTIVIQMVNLTVYRLRAVDDTSTWLIEEENTFEATQDFERVLEVIKRRMRWFSY